MEKQKIKLNAKDLTLNGKGKLLVVCEELKDKDMELKDQIELLKQYFDVTSEGEYSYKLSEKGEI